jgi:hypothetical protein
MTQLSDQLFRQVATRSRLSSFAQWSFRFVLVFAGLYLVLLVLGRLLALVPDWYQPWTVALIPAAALLAAALAHRGINTAEAARLVDVRMDTKDLYLTAATLATAPGEYKPLIAAAAEEQARSIRPSTVVPFDPWNRSAVVTLVLGLLLLAAWQLPSLDPFKRQEEQMKVADRIKKLEHEKLAAKQKIDALKEKELDAKTSKEVEKMLAELKKSFDQMKKNEKESNLAKLNEQQRLLGEKWRQAQEQKLKETSRDKMAQQLGGMQNSPKSQEWKKELAQGKTDALKEQLKEVQKLAEKAQDAKSETEKNAAKQDAQKKLQELNDFIKSNAGSKELSEALQKAAEQLAQSGDPQAQQQAMDAMKESMKLSEQQLEQLAQSIRDQKSLEEALKAIQGAKQANAQDKLDGEACKECENMGQYAELFKKLGGGGDGDSESMAEGSDGDGTGTGPNSKEKGTGGTGGEGLGKGGRPPEDPSVKTAFKSEKSKSALHAGKTLMQWKTQEVAEPGKAKVDYKQAVEKVKQGVSEAILQEEIPPGYHEAIQKYFDSVEKAGPGAPGAGQKGPVKDEGAEKE